MLRIEAFNRNEINKIRRACAYLFSPEDANSDHFLRNLDLVNVKAAFRKKAKRYHPDLHNFESAQMIARREERFLKIQASYETLTGHLTPSATAFPGEEDTSISFINRPTPGSPAPRLPVVE